jgi:hypothetical protein
MNRLWLLLILLAFLSCTLNKNAKNHGSKISAANIFKLELGMTKKEVIQIVGEPIPTIDTCRNEWTMTQNVDCNHSMIWLGFDDSTNRLEHISVTYFDDLDDYSVYGVVTNSDSIRRWGCPNEKELSQYIR